MLVIAKAVKGKEFLYNPKSARQVSKASAKKILSVLNEKQWDLKPGETWFLYDDISEYDAAFVYAEYQSFKIRKGVISAYSY